METSKTELHYYLKVGSVSTSKFSCPSAAYIERNPHIHFQHPSFLSITHLAKYDKENSFQGSQNIAPEFYKISFKKALSNADLQNNLLASCITPEGPHQKTEKKFKIRVSDLIASSKNKESFSEKLTVSSEDSNYRIEIIIIPSYNQLTTDVLERIVEHEDSKITVDSLTRLENLPTEQSLGYLQRNSKFKRSTKQSQLKLEKKHRKLNTNRESILLQASRLSVPSPQSPGKSGSPIKRCQKLRRSQLIPKQFVCEMQEIDEHQTMKRYEKYVSNGIYMVSLVLQLIVVIYLMNPSAKV